MSEPALPSDAIISAVEQAGGRVTVADVASGAGVSLSEAKKSLTALAQLADGHLEVSSDGQLIYAFGSVRATLLAKSSKARIMESWKKVEPVMFYLMRVSFGVALLASIALIFTAIVALQSSTRRDDDDREGGSFGGGGGMFRMGPSFWWGPSPFDFLFWNSYQPYGVNRYEEPEEKMSFLESVFSFLFGDGDPNYGIAQKRSQAVGQLIRSNGGALTAEQLAPYMDPDYDYGQSTTVDESWVLPAVTEFGGVPDVTADGDIIYVFDDMQTSAIGTGDTTLGDRSTKELQAMAMREGISTAGMYDKSDLVAGITSALEYRRSTGSPGGGASQSLSATGQGMLVEDQYEFSLASQGQLIMVGVLAAVNLGAGLYLANLLASPVLVGKTLVGLLGFVKGALPFLLAYGTAFAVIPALRYFKMQRDNKTIEERNRKRATWSYALKIGGEEVTRKIGAAQARAQGLTTVGKDDVEYTTGQSIEEQGLDLKMFDEQYNLKSEDSK